MPGRHSSKHCPTIHKVHGGEIRMSAEFDNVLTISQTLIRDAAGEDPVTTELIVSKVDLALSLNPAWQAHIDRSKLIKELETRFSIWIGTESFLSGNDDHIPWL